MHKMPEKLMFQVGKTFKFGREVTKTWRQLKSIVECFFITLL